MTEQSGGAVMWKNVQAWGLGDSEVRGGAPGSAVQSAGEEAPSAFHPASQGQTPWKLWMCCLGSYG